MKSLDNVRKRAYNIITANANERKAKNHRKDGENMEDKIKKLAKLVGQLSKLALKIIELLTYATVIELSVKTMIELWK